MFIRNWKRTPAIAGLVLAALAGSNMGAAASTATISGTAQQTIKGWGDFPSYFRSDWGSTFTMTGRTTIQDAVYAMGLTYIRVDVEPRLYVSGTTVSNIVLDSTSVTDLENQLQYAKNHGVTSYIMSCWSPPAVWKDNGSIDGGHLISGDAQYYANYYTKVIQTLNSAGYGLPMAISVQNEPDINAGYDSCVYNDSGANITLWGTVVKDMRSTLNSNSMSSVVIFGPEGSNTDTNISMLGGNGFPTLGSDSALNAALGAYAIHGYSECSWTGELSGQANYPKDAWVTEWSAISCNFAANEMGWLIPTFAHMGSNLVDLHANYWTWWMGWGDGTGAPDDEHLLSGDTAPIYSKRYYVFQKLWTTVRPGWVVKTMTCDNGSFTTSNNSNITYTSCSCDTFVDLVGFEPANGTSSAVMLINPTGSSVSMTTNGLKGATYIAYQTDSSHDMANIASGNVSGGGATVNLTANSVTIIVTAAGSGAPAAPTGLTATAGNSQVSLSWTASSGATSYNVLRSTVSGSGYASVATGISTTAYTNTGLTNGTTYYFVVTATNSSGTSGNSNQASATPSAGSSGLVKINAAGPAVSPFIADTDFSGGTTATNWTGTIDTSAVTSPAPQAVYQSERYGAMTYTIGGLTANTTYQVRLHFCENYFTTSAQRTFNVSINGTSELSNFDIYATTGAIHKATCQQFNVAANGSGQEVIVFTNVTNNALINGIEVNAAGSPPPAPTGLVATPGNAQVALTWNASSGATAYDVKRSTVSGSGYATVSSPTTTSYTNTGLTNGTTYYFVVDAKNANGTSANSSQVSATPTSGGSGNTHGGTWSCKAVMTTTPSYTNAWETVTVPTNQTYVASVWIKGTGAVLLKVLNGNWGTEITGEVRCNATSTWQQYSTAAFNTGSNTQLTYVLQDQYGVAGTAYLDDAFQGVSAGTNTLVNPGFESGNVDWGPSGAFSIGQF